MWRKVRCIYYLKIRNLKHWIEMHTSLSLFPILHKDKSAINSKLAGCSINILSEVKIKSKTLSSLNILKSIVFNESSNHRINRFCPLKNPLNCEALLSTSENLISLISSTRAYVSYIRRTVNLWNSFVMPSIRASAPLSKRLCCRYRNSCSCL